MTFRKLTRTLVSASQGVVVASVCTATTSTKSLDLGAESSLQTTVIDLVYCLSDRSCFPSPRGADPPILPFVVRARMGQARRPAVADFEVQHRSLVLEQMSSMGDRRSRAHSSSNGCRFSQHLIRCSRIPGRFQRATRYSMDTGS